jgi:hypothetical protein
MVSRGDGAVDDLLLDNRDEDVEGLNEGSLDGWLKQFTFRCVEEEDVSRD